MKIRAFYTVFLIILIGVLFAFATPGVNFKVGGKTIKFDGLNLKTISGNKYKGELQFGNGLDIRGGKKYTLQTSLANVAADQREKYSKDLVDKFAARLELYGYNRLNSNAFKQFDLRWSIVDDNLNIELTAPEKSSDDYQIVNLLGSKGKLEIWTQDPSYDSSKETEDSNFSFLTGMKQSQLTVDDIESIESVYSSKANGYGFRLTFKKEARIPVTMMNQLETSRGTMLVIDSQPIAYRTYAIENIESGSKSKPVIYVTSFFQSFSVNDTIPAINQGGELDQALTLTDEKDITPLLGEHYEWDMKLALGIAALLITVLLVAKYRLHGLYFEFLISLLGLGNLTLLKLFKLGLTLPLVLGTAAGLAFSLVLHTIILREISKNVQDNQKIEKIADYYKKVRADYRNLAFFVMGNMVILNMLPVIEVSDFAYGFGIMMFTLLISIYTFPNLLYVQILSIKNRYETRKKS